MFHRFTVLEQPAEPDWTDTSLCLNPAHVVVGIILRCTYSSSIWTAPKPLFDCD